MAVNPIQRRTRNALIIGLLIGIICAVGVWLIYAKKVKNLNTEIENLKAKCQMVYVTNKDLESGAVISVDDLSMEEVQTTLTADQIIGSDYFASEYVDEDGNSLDKFIVKIDVPAGTILTQGMISNEADEFDKTQRLQEYNMIVLPTLLKNGDYVDIRIKLASGADFIVLSKKRIEGCTNDTIWMNMSEEDMLVLGNAIVEAYVMNGSKLYATIYTEAGLQDASTQTYVVNSTVAQLIEANPNIEADARNALIGRYLSDYEKVRTQNIDPAVSANGDYDNTVEGKLSEEISKINAARQEYVESLAGTGMTGMSE